MSGRQVREAPAMLTQIDTGTSCWLRRDGRAKYRCPYLTFEQQLLAAYQNFEHRTTTDARSGLLLMKKAQETEPASYVARFRQARSTVQSLSENP